MTCSPPPLACALCPADTPWRNHLALDPLARYGGGMNYWETMLLPLSKALAYAVRPTTTVWIAYTGEMGAAVFQVCGGYWRNEQLSS